MILSFRQFTKLSLELLLVVFAFISLTSCSQESVAHKHPLRKITWATTKSTLMTPVWIAKEMGFFEEFGLEAEFMEFDSGLRAFDAVLTNQADFANCSDFVAAQGIMLDPSIVILASQNRGIVEQLVARRDRGINSLEDLKGKRIGLLMGSTSEFFLNFYLSMEGIPLESITLTNIEPDDQLKAIVEEKVDAIQTWEPFATRIAEKLGENAINWSTQEGLKANWLLVSRWEFVKTEPDTVLRVLKAILKAEDFINRETMLVLKTASNYVHPISTLDLNKHTFQIALDRPLLIALEAQARWLRKKDPLKFAHAPNFLDSIYFQGLQSIDPNRVNVSVGW